MGELSFTAQNEIGYIIFCGLNHLLKSWLEDGHCRGFGDISINTLEEMVDYYCTTYYVSGIHLKDRLEELKARSVA